MPRPPEPEKRQAALDACYVAAIEAGHADVSLAALAERTGISARMLVYHFGSREALQRALAEKLEADLRARFAGLAEEAPARRVRHAALELWDRLASEETRGILRLAMDVVHQAQRGDPDAGRMAEREVGAWSALLAEGIDDPAVADGLILLVLGAAVDLLSSGDASRGRRAIAAFLSANGL